MKKRYTTFFLFNFLLAYGRLAVQCSVNYAARTTSRGTKFSWSRAARTGVRNAESRGEDSTIMETLDNTTDQPVVVDYVFVLTPSGADTGCTVTRVVKVTVNPTTTINPVRDTAFCNRAQVGKISLKSSSPGATFTWTNDNPSIGLPRSGIGTIPSFIATNTTNVRAVATIKVSIKASADSCAGPVERFRITVNPSLQQPAFTSLNNQADSIPLSLCEKSENINFNVTSPLGGLRYDWRITSSTGQQPVLIRDSSQANTVISFRTTGDYTIQVCAQDSVTTCFNAVSQTVRVTTNRNGIEPGKIFQMKPGDPADLLVYPDNSLSGYQWGVDTIRQTPMGPEFGKPVPITGQVNPYFIAASPIDTTKYLYWVQLQNGTNCHTRVYYNGPYATRRVRTDVTGSMVQLQVIPNPNSGQFALKLTGAIYGRMEVKVYNALGHVMIRKSFVKTIPEVTEAVKAGNLPASLYYPEPLSSDLKKIVSRFVVQH